MNTDKVTERIIGCAIKVSNGLGIGFLEKVYENALALELRRNGLQVEQQKRMAVHYEGWVVGDYTSDFLINSMVVVELKVAKTIDEIHQAQLLNYLRASQLKIGLILNFGTKQLGIKRMIL